LIVSKQDLVGDQNFTNLPELKYLSFIGSA